MAYQVDQCLWELTIGHSVLDHCNGGQLRHVPGKIRHFPGFPEPISSVPEARVFKIGYDVFIT